jgi:hypothetical protein
MFNKRSLQNSSKLVVNEEVDQTINEI